jgi:hypothetical protein
MSTAAEMVKWSALCAKLAAKSAASAAAPGSDATLELAAIVLEFCGVELETTSKNVAQINENVRKLIHSAYKRGMMYLADAQYAPTDRRRCELIDQARQAFSRAVTQDAPLQAAQAEVLTGACFYQLGEKVNALRHLEQGYLLLGTLEKAVLENCPAAREPPKPVVPKISPRRKATSFKEGVIHFAEDQTFFWAAYLYLCLSPFTLPATAVVLGWRYGSKLRREHARALLEDIYAWMRPLSALLYEWGSTELSLRPANQLFLPSFE